MNHSREAWMATFAKAPLSEIERHWATISPPRFEWVRRPELGMIMLRGRIAKGDAPFNVGEATIARCTVQIESGEIGVAYVLGRSKRHAALAALLDALMQRETRNGTTTVRSIVDALNERIREEATRVKNETYSSKVDFFMYGQGG
ncbi:phosphonate C-P lyase system protein PhnG [Agrobacterium tumefaciens]|uniref:phosphonate C-P lyase system protein PhnG n=1 Tax=Agrobacterium tumefaciens TaxID=358 RepID=UPI00157343D5|nr:phosphonate C-P lyase system protein PhnG [Agrobacterium tumefaciens]NTE66138.1 phosphonate C-P lyase system protein PhnG [Agrobacterium tumefaciens]